MAELKPFRGNYYLWKYLPSVALAAVSLVLFLLVTFAHGWRLCRSRRWFCIPFIVGGFMEIVGYAARISCYDKTDKLMPFAIQSSYILLAPVLFAATIYMTFGRVVLSIPGGRVHSPISPRWTTKIFVTGDILTLCVQAGASGLMFNQSTVNIGNGVIIGGLVLQVLLFAVFVVFVTIFHLRLRRYPSIGTTVDRLGRESFYMLYSVSALILFRSVFRLIEYIGGRDGYLLSTEWPLYIFDTLPMFLVMVVFYFWYPEWVQRSKSKSAQSDNEELQGEVREVTKMVGTGFNRI